jgi:aldehyde dehydrogenase (NAD+)
VLFEFYGEEPLRSPDLSRVVNSNHFNRLMALMDDYSVSGNVAFGGQIDERRL